MEIHNLHKLVYRKLILGMFFLVLLLSLYMVGELNWPSILFALFKACIGALVAWFFFLITGDAISKSIEYSVSHLSEQREQGGLLYHFLKPHPSELPPENELENKKPLKNQKTKDKA